MEPASGDQLKRLWNNMKTRQREALTKERQHRLATGGGGPCPDAQINPEIEEVAPALLVEIPNALDSDSIGPTTSHSRHPSQRSPVPSTSQQDFAVHTDEIEIEASQIISFPILPPPSITNPTICLPIATITHTHTITSASQPTIHHVTSTITSHTVTSASQSTPHSPLSRTLPLTSTSHSTINSASQIIRPTPLERESNEKKLRTEILRNEHYNRERRAQELHTLQLQQMTEKHQLEIEILKEKLNKTKHRAGSQDHQ